jgi:hypothetical protein
MFIRTRIEKREPAVNGYYGGFPLKHLKGLALLSQKWDLKVSLTCHWKLAHIAALDVELIEGYVCALDRR